MTTTRAEHKRLAIAPWSECKLINFSQLFTILPFGIKLTPFSGALATLFRADRQRTEVKF